MEEIRAARRRNNKRAEARLKALELCAKGKSCKEIGAITGFHPAYITTLTAKYRTGGIETISGNHYRGNHRNMSREREAELLEGYVKRSEEGQIVEVSKIKAKYEEAVGHKTGSGQVYKVLARHGRKVMSRSRHPKKADEEVIETSKNSPNSFRMIQSCSAVTEPPSINRKTG